MLYLSVNRTIRKETHELLLKLLGVNLNGLSEQTRAEVRQISRIENKKAENGKERLKRVKFSLNHNQIYPLQTFNDMGGVTKQNNIKNKQKLEGP